MFFAAIFVCVIGFALAVHGGSLQLWRKHFQALAAEFDLDYTQGNWFTGPRVEGQIEGRNVVIDRYRRRGKRNQKWRTRVRVETDFPPGLQLRQETLGASLGKALLGNDTQTGDPSFDGQVLVRGADETSVLACMTQAARDAVVLGLSTGTHFDDGYASVTRSGRVRHVGVVRDMLNQAMSAGLASRSQGSSTAEQLAFNALHDNVLAVRVKNFQKLLDWNPNAERTEACTHELSQSDEPVLRAMACVMLPDDVARASLVGGLTDAAAGQRLSDGHALMARQLGRRFPESPVLRQITPWLLSQLHRDDASTAVNAAKALGSFADISVVEPMLAATRGRAKKAIREAIVEIQGRATGGLGQLSVVQTQSAGGALSMAKEQGQVSVVEQEATEIEH